MTFRSMPQKRSFLAVSYASTSYLIQGAAQIEVRDERHELVTTLRNGDSIDIEPGLYSVSAVLDTGERRTQHIQIREGETTRVRFESQVGGLETMGSAREVRPAHANPFGTTSVKSDPDKDNHVVDDIWLYGAPDNLRFEVLGRRLRVNLVEATSAVPWIALRNRYPRPFDSFADYATMTALYVGEDVVHLALPIDGRNSETRSCTVTIGKRTNGPFTAASVELPPARRVTNMLRSMFDAGNSGAAHQFATEASRLLFDKYSDPFGAAYGALMLCRFGALEAHLDWLENLARDFAWIPDGRIVLAATLARDPNQRERAFEILLDAITKDVAFTDAFSLALSLLRRWPDAAKRETCLEQVDLLRHRIARYDFATTTATQRWSLS